MEKSEKRLDEIFGRLQKKNDAFPFWVKKRESKRNIPNLHKIDENIYQHFEQDVIRKTSFICYSDKI